MRRLQRRGELQRHCGGGFGGETSFSGTACGGFGGGTGLGLAARLRQAGIILYRPACLIVTKQTFLFKAKPEPRRFQPDAPGSIGKLLLIADGCLPVSQDLAPGAPFPFMHIHNHIQGHTGLVVLFNLFFKVKRARAFGGNFDNQCRANAFLGDVEGAAFSLRVAYAEDKHNIRAMRLHIRHIPGDAQVARDQNRRVGGKAGFEHIMEIGADLGVFAVLHNEIVLLGMQDIVARQRHAPALAVAFARGVANIPPAVAVGVGLRRAARRGGLLWSRGHRRVLRLCSALHGSACV